MLAAQPYLETFSHYMKSHPGPAAWTCHFDSGKLGPHRIFSSIVHGNETGSLPAVTRFMSSLAEGARKFEGKATFILGNVPACIKNERFIEADLNRVFTKEAPDSAERRRALELMPILQSADLFVDFHQTTMPCLEPFYIFAFEERSYHWARLIEGAKILITRSAKEKFTANSLCIDEYARHFGIPSVTVELGQAGLTQEAEAVATQMLERIFAQPSELFRDNTLLREEAEKKPDFNFVTISAREPFDDRKAALKPGLVNLSKVTKGEYLGDSQKGPYTASIDGLMLFPKYPKRDENGDAIGPLTGEMYMLLTPLGGHPRDLFRD